MDYVLEHDSQQSVGQSPSGHLRLDAPWRQRTNTDSLPMVIDSTLEGREGQPLGANLA